MKVPFAAMPMALNTAMTNDKKTVKKGTKPIVINILYCYSSAEGEAIETVQP